MTEVAPSDREGRADRCAEASRLYGVDPIGTAVSAWGFLLVEWPRPWPRDVSEVPALRPLVDHLQQTAGGGGLHRLQLIEASTPHPEGKRRVILHRRGADGFGGYVRHEVTCAPADLVASAQALVSEHGADPLGLGDNDRDVLVCTHGTRDICCGSSGTRLFEELAGHFAGEVHMNVWRTSHLGGHRFAPTIATFPEGQYWGYLDRDRAVSIVGRTAEMTEVRACYRGSAGFSEPAVQAVEREAFTQQGWAWLDTSDRQACSAAQTASAAEVDVCLTYSRPDGSSGGLRAKVTQAGATTIPPCRSGPGAGTTDHEWIVSDLREDSGEDSLVI